MASRSQSRGRRHTPPTSTSLSAVLQTGLRLLDEDGVEGVSMRRIADELNVGTMSLYRYVRTKDELLDRIADLVLVEGWGEPPAGESLQARLARAIDQLHLILRDHPGVAELILSRPPPIPALDPFRETMLSILRQAGYSVQEAVDGLTALSAYAIGYVAIEHARPSGDSPGEAHRLGHLSPARYPHLSEAAAAYETHVSERAFRSGLDRLVSGVGTEVTSPPK
jgi:AcrR family transcriptional regulator